MRRKNRLPRKFQHTPTTSIDWVIRFFGKPVLELGQVYGARSTRWCNTGLFEHLQLLAEYLGRGSPSRVFFGPIVEGNSDGFEVNRGPLGEVVSF